MSEKKVTEEKPIKCPDCGKFVYDKPILGTLHFCLTLDERKVKKQISYLIDQQNRCCPIKEVRKHIESLSKND